MSTPNTHRPHETGNVIPLRPADTTGSEVESVIHDAEIVPDEPGTAIERRPRTATGRAADTKAVVVATARRVHTVATHDTTKTVAKSVLRNVLYVPAGAKVVGKRLWDSRTTSRYERMMRAAEAARDMEALTLWEERGERFKAARHSRHMDWLEAPKKVAQALFIGALSLLCVLIGLGVILACAQKDIAAFLDPFNAILSFVSWVVIVVTVTWGPLVLAAPWVGVAWLWQAGRRAQLPGMSWLQSTKDRDREGGVLVTADAIVRALRHLNIPALNKSFKEDWMPRFDLAPTREGSGVFKGYRAIFDLPLGVTPTMVADKRDVLATNLLRNQVEVWPSDFGQEKGGKPGFVNLYVADAGVMDKPTPQYPLMHEGTADVFAGVPVGITQRGDLITYQLVGSNFGFGGRPGQGKSNAARVVMAGAALDPLAELRVHVFAGNGDFDAFAPRLARYHKGATKEHAQIATEHLSDLNEEVNRREERLAEIGAKKVTRPIAVEHPDLRPIVAMFSECHELFTDDDCGKQAAELAISTVKRGRKVGIILGFDTQSSRADAIPSQLVENLGINGCFSVKTWRSNDGFLGDGSFAAGIRATELRFNVDRGTMIATGVSDELFEIVRTFFLEVNDDTGWDAATDIIARAMAALTPGTPVAGDRPAPAAAPVRDLLDDLDEVLDIDPVPAGEVIGALRTLAPTWRPYKALTVPKLVAALGQVGIKVPTSKNKYPIDPVTVRKTLAVLATADLDDDNRE